MKGISLEGFLNRVGCCELIAVVFSHVTLVTLL